MCTRCTTRPRAPLASNDADLIAANARLHAQLRRAADLSRADLVKLKDWEATLRSDIRRGRYCRPCLQAWTASIPTSPPPDED